jgi:DNA-binding CsgD family transcriptional regulator
MSAVNSGKHFVWQVVAPNDGARRAMEECVRRGGFVVLVRTRIAPGEQLASVAVVILITPRELDTLTALAAHDRVSEMAKALHVADITVYTHLENLMQKFEVNSYHRLLLEALACRLLIIQECPQGSWKGSRVPSSTFPSAEFGEQISEFS